MKNKQLLKLYSQSNYMVVNRDLAKKIGLTQSIVFGQLCSLQDSMGEWFYFTQDKLADACCVSIATIKRSVTELRSLGYIKTKRKGNPCKTLYSIQWSNLIAQNELTSKLKMTQQDSSKWSNKISNKQSSNKSINKEIYKETEIEEIYNSFSQICISLPKPKKLTDTRKKAIRSRLKEYGKETIIEVFQKTNNSDFLSGRNSEWIASFDWIMKPANFVKILEDTYVNKAKQSTTKIYGKGKEQEYLDSIGEW